MYNEICTMKTEINELKIFVRVNNMAKTYFWNLYYTTSIPLPKALMCLAELT